MILLTTERKDRYHMILFSQTQAFSVLHKDPREEKTNCEKVEMEKLLNKPC